MTDVWAEIRMLEADGAAEDERKAAMVRPKQVKIVQEGQPCRKCGTPVVKSSHTGPSKPGQAYWFAWWFRCPRCKAVYMVEEAKRPAPSNQTRLF